MIYTTRKEIADAVLNEYDCVLGSHIQQLYSCKVQKIGLDINIKPAGIIRQLLDCITILEPASVIASALIQR